MKTYQDLISIGEDEQDRKAFILSAINTYKGTEQYKTAVDAEMYYKHLNPTIMRFQKIVYDLMGKAVPDIWSANHKIPSRFYFYFITQAVQFLLGNGVSFGEDNTKEKLGKKFDNVIMKAATDAQNGGVSYCFWNVDHLEQFAATEFVPLYDEETGALKAGIRWWQVKTDKPLRATLYELDGYTEYIKKRDEEMQILQPKRSYKQIVAQSEVSGVEIFDGGNYPTFPIVPLYNINKQSELVGEQGTLDAYDLMASGLVNNVDDANVIYWVIRNAGGMDDVDDQRFIQRLKTLHVAHLEGDEQVDQHSVNVPFQASETALARLRNQLFDDFMALDTKEIAGGATTATQIRAAYEPLNAKTDMFEYQVTECILGILDLVGIDDEPTYTRSMIINQSESITTLLSAGEYLPKDYITKKVVEILGDIDQADEIVEQVHGDEMERYAMAMAMQESTTETPEAGEE